MRSRCIHFEFRLLRCDINNIEVAKLYEELTAFRSELFPTWDDPASSIPVVDANMEDFSFYISMEEKIILSQKRTAASIVVETSQTDEEVKSSEREEVVEDSRVHSPKKKDPSSSVMNENNPSTSQEVPCASRYTYVPMPQGNRYDPRQDYRNYNYPGTYQMNVPYSNDRMPERMNDPNCQRQSSSYIPVNAQVQQGSVSTPYATARNIRPQHVTFDDNTYEIPSGNRSDNYQSTRRVKIANCVAGWKISFDCNSQHLLDFVLREAVLRDGLKLCRY